MGAVLNRRAVATCTSGRSEKSSSAERQSRRWGIPCLRILE
jgi:hypothetical protein